MTTPLPQRMALHVPGQITWPEPELKKFCDSCAHYSRRGNKADAEKGRCYLVSAHHRVQGLFFKGADATAWPQWRRIEP